MTLIENITQLISNAPILFGILFFFFGTIIASFFNVVILRYPKVSDYENSQEVKAWFEEKGIAIPVEIDKFEKISLSFPSSHCYSCHKPLKWYHNIPVFSYLFLRGKCGYCETPISAQYPIVEFIGGLVMLFSYCMFFPMGLLHFIFGSIFLMALFVSASIDIKSYMLPDGITYFLMWSGLALALFNFSLFDISIKESVAGALVGYLLCRIVAEIGRLIKGEAVMGDGDLKLLAMLGVFIGVKGAVFTFFAAPFFGFITWIAFKVVRKGDRMIPYGPSLMLAGCYYLLFKNYIPDVVTEILSLIPKIYI